MNILVDRLPTTIEIDGASYRIDADFRACLRIIMAFEDSELTQLEKYLLFFDNLYIDKPGEVETALKRGAEFLNCGKEDGEYGADAGLRVFSWNKDANLIYAAFQQTHGIDLTAVEFMHWWRFVALFMDMGSDTAFCNLVGLRQKVMTGKASKEERQAAREMGQMFVVDPIDDRSIEEIEAERAFMELIRG